MLNFFAREGFKIENIDSLTEWGSEKKVSPTTESGRGEVGIAEPAIVDSLALY